MQFIASFFHVALGEKQVCVLSPTLFSIYVNDLVSDIKEAYYGIQIDDVILNYCQRIL